MPQEGSRIHLSSLLVELDEGEVRDAIDGEEHVQLAIGVAQLAAVDVDVADRGLGEATALRHRLVDRQTRDAVADEAAMQARTRQLRDLVAQAPSVATPSCLRMTEPLAPPPMTSSSGSSVRWRNATMIASSAGVRTVL